MKTKQIAIAIRNLEECQGCKTITSHVLIHYLADYIERFKVKSEDKWADIFHTEQYLPEILLRAIINLVDSDEEWVKKYREQYRKHLDRNEDFTDPTKVSASMFANLALIEMESIIKDALGNDFRGDFDLLHGEFAVLHLFFKRFMDKIYIKGGMMDIINKSKFKGVGGKFGKTKFLTWDGIGRLMVTFQRGKNPKSPNYKSITFIMESDKDKVGLGSGIQSCYSDVITALQMIKDVEDNWDPQKFVMDGDISII